MATHIPHPADKIVVLIFVVLVTSWFGSCSYGIYSMSAPLVGLGIFLFFVTLLFCSAVTAVSDSYEKEKEK